MKQDKKEIDKIIKKNLELDQLTSEFTSKLMNRINAEELASEGILKSALQENALYEPSVNFTKNVLSKIEHKQKEYVYQPVIGNNTLRFVAVLVVGIGLYAFFFGAYESSSSRIMPYLEKLSNISLPLPKILTSHLFAMSVFAMSSLLFIDYQLKNKSQS